MDGRRPFWHSTLLHTVLIFGSLVFALPFVWLIGTSWKLDKEIQTDRITLMPRRPEPRPSSPYVDGGVYQLERPDDIPADRWDGVVRRSVEEELGRAVDGWNDPRTAGLDRDELRRQLVAGAFKRLRSLLPAEVWRQDEAALRKSLAAAIKPDQISDSFAQVYRCFSLGKVVLKDSDRQLHDLTANKKPEQVWTVAAGEARIEPQSLSEGDVAVVRYDLSKNERVELAADLPLPVPFESKFKRLDVAVRPDETWHSMNVFIEVGGKLLRSVSPKYLGEDKGLEYRYQLPSDDDTALVPHRYVLLEEADRGPQYDHGPGRIRVRVELVRSGVPSAYWAKASENYKRVFNEVPFWRYLKTSAFLAIMNIVGGAFACSLAAYAFARLQWPGRDFCFYLVLATMMIPPQITMIPSFVIYKYLGWYNTLAPLWVPSFFAINAFGIFLLRQAMKGIPRDLEDAARIDGCGFLRTWWHVAMPLMKPTLAVMSVFTFLYVWNDFLGPLIYVNDQRLYPLALGLFAFMANRETEFAWIMAGAMIMTLPVILLFFFAQRYFIQGVTMTGVKG